MNKSINKNANIAQKSAKSLTEIGIYNQEVKSFLKSTSLNPIIQAAIKNFNDSAYRRKLTNLQYNKEVEEFNTTHGYYLLKKGTETEVTKYYSYINYPYLDRNAIKATMDNYRSFVYQYNKKADEENKLIRNYNNSVVKSHYSLNDAEKKRKTNFERTNKSKFVRDYNELVIEANEQNAIIPKKRIQKIKYASELVFHVLVGFYVSQLKTRNAYLMEMNRPTSVLKNALPKLKIDHRKLATHKIADIPRLDICKKTAQNHIKRLREAGVLINYLMINQNKPISVNFNAQILEILDGFYPKSQKPTNQQVNHVGRNFLHDNSECNYSVLKEKKRKGCAKSTSLNKCGSMLEENESNNVCPADGYENTKGINKKISLEGGEKINLPNFLTEKRQTGRKTNQLSDNFLSKLINQKTFAEKLAAGEFDNYKGLRYDYLLKIEQYALVSNDEFKQIIIQDFIKSSAKIWRNHTVYVGEWKKTINQLNEELFSNITQKETIIKKLREYRWKLKFAKNWFDKNTEVKTLFPYAYFDKTRVKSNELGFYGLHSVWKSHLKYLEKRKEEKKNLEAAANERKRKTAVQKKKTAELKKLTNAIKKYESGQYNLEQLFNYVQDNLPHDYLILLPNMIKNQNTNLA
ncbi:hypothetical protein [Tenacibaculum caenipelagi]|uniref:Uncharacterized protein n=1 Tax=Tenacibaculum caenipelagi TaxID=1325435 RepID=A0A4R6TCW5_9FLAO|nr:hypothetical protein [Tenacibaculum caenipelagi]TDQ22777.1 hypothetical protein DFQ07_2795 [Tenacibaculum caenipelagi]